MTQWLLAAPAPDVADACSALPLPARVACEGARGIAGGANGLATDAVGAGADAVLDGLAGSFASAGEFFLSKLGPLLTSTTRIDVTSPWFLERYAVVFGVSALLTAVLLLLAVTKAVLRGDGMEAVRAATVHCLAAVLAGAFAPAFVYLVVRLSDATSAVLTVGAAADTGVFLEGVGRTLAQATAASPGVGAAVLLITSGFVILCSVILWIELLLRTAIIYVSLLFAAPTFSGLVDRALWRHTKRWVYFTVSVAFAKPVVVAVMTLAAAGAGAGSPGDGFTSVFVAVALMAVAIFCVGLLFRLVPDVGDQVAQAVNARREIKSGTPNSPLPNAGTVVRQSLQAHLMKAGAGGARAATPAVGLVGPLALSAHRALRPSTGTSPVPAQTTSKESA